MIVFRVENESGIGPYYCNAGAWCDGAHNHTTGRPMSYEDGIDHAIAHNSMYRFGFDSMAKLTDWFTQLELSRLYAEGYKIVTFEVGESNVVRGFKQVMFIRDCATIVLDVCPTAELSYVQEAA